MTRHPNNEKNLTRRIGSVRNYIDQLAFTRAWFDNRAITGAVAPSSPRLARAMASAAAPPPDTEVIELGPGTGVVTDALIEAGVEEKNLVLVERNPVFHDLLRQRFPAAQVLCEDAFKLLLGRRNHHRNVSAVVSSLPLLSYPVHWRRKLLEAALSLLPPYGRMVQFTYAGRSPIPDDEEVRATRSRWIVRNLPPAVVWTYQSKRTPVSGQSEGLITQC